MQLFLTELLDGPVSVGALMVDISLGEFYSDQQTPPRFPTKRKNVYWTRPINI